MVDLEPGAPRADHEAAIEQYLLTTDAELGAILAPFLKFDRLENLSDTDRRRVRAEIAAKVREVLDADEPVR
jgi:hypothetical protein